MITPHFLSKWSLRPNAPVFLLCGAALFAAVSPLPIAAQSAPSVITTSENEIARRQARVTNAEALLEKSRRAAADKNPEAAYSLALQAVDLLPGGLPNDPNRASTISAFSQTAMDYANWLISQWRYQDA